MDVIFISELRVETLVGVYEWERHAPQKVQLDLEIGLPVPAPGSDDDLDGTIDYAAVVARIEASLAGSRFGLLERLAEHIAALLMSEFRSPWVRVSAAKLGTHRNVRRIGVTIERGTKR